MPCFNLHTIKIDMPHITTCCFSFGLNWIDHSFFEKLDCMWKPGQVVAVEMTPGTKVCVTWSLRFRGSDLSNVFCLCILWLFAQRTWKWFQRLGRHATGEWEGTLVITCWGNRCWDLKLRLIAFLSIIGPCSSEVGQIHSKCTPSASSKTPYWNLFYWKFEE